MDTKAVQCIKVRNISDSTGPTKANLSSGKLRCFMLQIKSNTHCAYR